MLRHLFAVLCLWAFAGTVVLADETLSDAAVATSFQTGFDQKYKEYLKADSQMLLPFPKLELQEWKNLAQTRSLQQLYVEPDRFYNNKVYTFTLYKAADDGSYYLDAKGGFWGMDELVYGPLQEQELK